MHRLIFTIALMLTMDFGISDMIMPSLREGINPANDIYNDSDTIQQFGGGSFNGLTILSDR